MTDERPCVGCPFRRDCPDCPWKGGTGSATTDFGAKCETIGVRKTAPDQCANTAEGLTTNDAVGVAMANPKHTRTTPPQGKIRGGV